jgi:steroid 5-alpha reductase family enzyme
MDSPEFACVAAATFAALLCGAVLVWLLSLRLKDASIADVFWGPGFAIVAWTATALSTGAPVRRALVLGLVTIWGLRLSLFLLRRNWGREDPHYAEMRRDVEARGGNFARRSLRTVFLAQGAFLWIVSLVLVFALTMDTPQSLGIPAFAGVALWCIGMFFEVVGDAQLARFRADPANRRKIMDRGLWRYTRHPNYFGESCIWFGFWLIACDNAYGLAFAFTPVLMTYVLVNLTGKALTERRMRQSRPDFEDYVRRTSGFIPLPPRA